MTAIVESDQEKLVPERHNNFMPNTLIFREDTYNTSSRVRRGRIYKASSTQPQTWHVAPHPLLNEVTRKDRGDAGHLRKEVYAYIPFRILAYLKDRNLKEPIFLLGSEGVFTIWTLVNVETTATGEESITLRARKSIGALPSIHKGKIPEEDRDRVLNYIDALQDDIFNASPESVVDRSREAAASIISAYLQDKHKVPSGNDLGILASKAEKHNLSVIAYLARTIARFHARTKNAEQERRSPRPISEQDAELAVQAVGTILCDLGWGTWKVF